MMISRSVFDGLVLAMYRNWIASDKMWIVHL